jgi:hypothetical protein
MATERWMSGWIPFVGWDDVPGAGATDVAPAATTLGSRLYVFAKGATGNIFVTSAPRSLRARKRSGARDRTRGDRARGSRRLL